MFTCGTTGSHALEKLFIVIGVLNVECTDFVFTILNFPYSAM